MATQAASKSSGEITESLLPKVELLASGEELSLRQWLEVSWFYPRGFVKEEIRETPSSILVFGEKQILKFIKPPRIGSSTFKDKWFAACDDYADNQELSPELYIGFWLIKITDGEFNWQRKGSWKEANRYVTPDADEVAIVLHRVAKKRILSEQLLSRSSISKGKISDIAAQLSIFHDRKKIEACLDGDLCTNSNQILILEQKVRGFVSEYSGYLDPYTQIALEQSASFITSFIRRKGDLLEKRIQRGLWIDSHGALTADKIGYYKPPSNSPDKPSRARVLLFARAPKTSLIRISDVLSDVASLVVDLETRGAAKLARVFEQAYFIREGDFYQEEVYRFFLVLQALLRAKRLMESSSTASLELAAKSISIALRAALGIRDNFFIGIIGDSSYADGVAEAISSLTGQPIANCSESEHDLSARYFITGEGDSPAADDNCLILRSHHLSLEQRELLSSKLEKRYKRYIFVDYQDSSRQLHFANPWLSTRLAHGRAVASYPLASEGSVPDSAFLILRQLCRVVEVS